MNPSPYPTRFTSAHGRAVAVKILLVVGAVATGMSLLVQAFSLAFPPLTEEQELGDNPISAAVILMKALLAVLVFMIYIATVVCFLVWLYRAYDNLRAFNRSSRLNHSSGWAVGSFFIPIVNLFVPYRAVSEVWQKSVPPDGFLSKVPGFFPVWWLFWLLASIAGNISTRVSFNEKVPESTATIISVVADALLVIAAVFAYLVVDEIDTKQEETSGKLGLGNFAAPPPPPANLSMSDVVAPIPGSE